MDSMAEQHERTHSKIIHQHDIIKLYNQVIATAYDR